MLIILYGLDNFFFNIIMENEEVFVDIFLVCCLIVLVVIMLVLVFFFGG